MSKSKKYRVKKKTGPADEIKAAFKKFNFRLAGKTALCFLAVFAVYQIGIYFEFKPMIHIYSIAVLILFVLYFILNRGLGKPAGIPDRASLPAEWSEEQKDDAVRIAEKTRKASKVILMLLVSFTLTLLLDMMWLFYIFNIKN
ncbi:MAG: hypothetical protein PUE85_03590 [Firmicutes bacterium]|nr:hypothetical protein [Bacillota bacterium]